MDGMEGAEQPSPLLNAYMARRADLIRFFAVRMRSEAAAEDLVQDLYLRVAGVDSREPVDNPSAYLYRLAVNLMLDRLRTDRRSGARDAAWREARHVTLDGEDVVDEPSPEQAAGARLRLAQAIDAIAALPPKTRRAFELHKLQGLSQVDTARTLGVSRKTVEKQISAALQGLLAKLGRSDG